MISIYNLTCDAPHVVQNLCDFLFLCKPKEDILKKCLFIFGPYRDVHVVLDPTNFNCMYKETIETFFQIFSLDEYEK